METNLRRSRFPDYTSTSNTNQNAQSTPLEDFLSRDTVAAQWGPAASQTRHTQARSRGAITTRSLFGSRGAIPNRSSGADRVADAFNLSSAGLDAPAASSAATKTPWGPSYWKPTNARHTRAASGNTSPQTRINASTHRADLYDIPIPNSSNTANTTTAGSRPGALTTSETPNGAFRYQNGLPRSYSDEGEGDQFGTSQPELTLPEYMATPASQDLSRHLRNSVAGRQDTSIQNHTDGFGDVFPYGIPVAAAVHSQRPSISGSTFSTQDVADAFRRMDVGGSSSGTANGPQSTLSYADGSQTFHLNPVSQPWGNGQGHGNGFGNDSFVNSSRLEQRGSIAGRDSPAGSNYRTSGGLNSPRNFTGTPQFSDGPWSRPVSREQRLAAELNGGLANTNMAQQHAFFQNGGYPPQTYPHFQTPYNRYTDFYPPAIGGYGGGPVAQFPLGMSAIPARPARDQDAGRAFRSPVLHEFKNSPKSRRWELQDIWGNIVEFSGDQQASRFIQGKLENANSEERNRVFAEIEPNAIQLMKDVFGNYVMQKLFEHGDLTQKRVLGNAMKGRVVDLSTQPYGCRVVQKALEHVLVVQQVELVKELEADLLNVAKDQHGNHVIQQAIALVPREHLNAIMGRFHGHVAELASHQYGCRVIQRILEHGSETDKASMMRELHMDLQTLLTDMYGNYVIQHVLEKGSPEERTRIIRAVTPRLLMLSRHKNASNVVEKCILFGTRQEQQAIRDQLLVEDEDNGSPLFQLMRDQYGNYVIQKLVKALHGRDRTVLVDQLAVHLIALRRSGATAKQIEAMERLVADTRAAAPTPASAPTAGEDEDVGELMPTSTAPPSPSLHVEVSSAAPTPNLTTNPNSPLSEESGSPPLPNGATMESVADRSGGGQLADKQTTPPLQPRVREA